MVLHNGTNLVLNKAVRPATKRSYLHIMHVKGLLCTPLPGFDKAVHVGPLPHKGSVSGPCFHVASYNIVGYYIDAKCGNHFRKFVLYQRVGMVRTSCKQYG